jgi:hypothetical protein
MDNLLKCAYILEHCQVCGKTYQVNLYHILLEQRTEQQWQTPRPCIECAVPREHAVAAVPQVQLEQLASAWDALASALAARSVSLHVHLAPPPGLEEPMSR